MKFQNKKERTIAYPHRLLNKISMWLLPLQSSNSKYYKGSYKSDESTITVVSNYEISPQDGRIFDYVLSRIQSISLENKTINVKVKDILDELGFINRTENRDKVVHSLQKIVDLTITLSWNTGSISAKLLDKVIKRDGNKELTIILDQSFIDAMDSSKAKIRYLNIQKTMHVKSKYAIELAKILQMSGRGVHKSTGKPNPVNEISHIALSEYLCLDNKTQSSITQVRKAFKELQIYEYPNYKYNSNLNTWKKQNT